jgi:hypothetical protein
VVTTVAEHRATRSVKISRRELRAGTLTLPAGVTFLATTSGQAGTFPHVPFRLAGEICLAALDVHWLGTSDVYDPWCTNAEPGHTLHVAHITAGLPIAAWTDDPELVVS